MAEEKDPTTGSRIDRKTVYPTAAVVLHEFADKLEKVTPGVVVVPDGYVYGNMMWGAAEEAPVGARPFIFIDRIGKSDV